MLCLWDCKKHKMKDYYIVEPNSEDHQVFEKTNYKEAVEKADVIALLVAHNEI